MLRLHNVIVVFRQKYQADWEFAFYDQGSSEPGLSLTVCHIHDQYKKTPPFQVVFFYIVFGPPVRTREESARG